VGVGRPQDRDLGAVDADPDALAGDGVDVVRLDELGGVDTVLCEGADGFGEWGSK
jgi:hypothetical protein